MNPTPFRIDPTFSPRIWGARSLAPIYPAQTNLPEPIGEAWLTDVNCHIATGPFAGKTLGEAWREMPIGWRGLQLANVAAFPLLVKFLFPTDKLSIQVHPDDAYAAVHEKAAGGRGKTEMWYVLSADPGAQVLLGFKPGTTKETFLTALDAGNVESLLNAVPVSAGDTIFVPARTVHAIGPGVILCEVQEYSDLTYRVHDYDRRDVQGRPRELHTTKALDVMTFGPTAAEKTTTLPLRGQEPSRSLLAACGYFATELWSVGSARELAIGPGHFEILVVLAGGGIFSSDSFRSSYRLGESWFVPLGTRKLSLEPTSPTTLLRTYVPDLATLRNELLQAGTSPSQLAKTVFD